jgi:ABC-type branched-subunit amino acid transport system ATPase component
MRAEGVSRRFRGLLALNDYNLDLHAGEILGSSARTEPAKPRCST